MANEVAKKILSILSPIMGKKVAESKLMNACSKLNLNQDSIETANLEALAREIAESSTGLGSNVAKRLEDRIKNLS